MSRIGAIGMFDGVHRGHRFLIDFMKEINQSDERPVIITFSNHPLSTIRSDHAPKLLSTAEEKSKLLESAGTTPVILKFDENIRKLDSIDFLDFLKKNYDITTLVMGFNNRFGNDKDSSIDHYKEIGERVGVNIIQAPEFCAGNEKISSSVIRKLLTEGEIEQANKLLGYEFILSGEVISGNKIGRTIGFPTANLSIDEAKILPLSGVYSADAITCDGQHYDAILNIGKRPTIEKDADQLHIEAYLKDFEGNLYGSNLTLELNKFLRPEKKFDSLTQLQAQIKSDLLQIQVSQVNLGGV